MLFDKRNEIKININDYNKRTDTVYEYIEPVKEELEKFQKKYSNKFLNISKNLLIILRV